MEQPAPTKPARPKSRVGSPATPSGEPSHSAPSPELLHTIQALQGEINELKQQRSLTDEERQELKDLKKELAELKAKAVLQHTPATPPPAPPRPKQVINYGTFSVVDD